MRKARISSWEHGLIRAQDDGASKLRGNYVVSRGEADAPDIDGRVYVRNPKSEVRSSKLGIGDFAEVRVIGHTDYDLIAELV